MDDKELDKSFRRALKRQELAVPESVWDRLESQLDVEEKKKGFIWWPLAMVASFALLFTLFWPQHNQLQPTPTIGPSPEQNIFLNPPQPSPVLQAPGEKPAVLRNVANTVQQPSISSDPAERTASNYLLQRISTPDLEEDRKRAERFVLYTAVLRREDYPKPSYLNVQFAAANDLLPALESPAEPYDEALKSYAINSLGQIIRGEEVPSPPSPKTDPVETIERGFQQVLAFQRDFFGRKKNQNSQP